MAQEIRDPFLIWKDGKSRMVHGVDYPAWAAQGWTLEPTSEEADGRGQEAEGTDSEQIAPSDAINPPELSAYAQRKAQLESLLKEAQGWQHIKRIATELGITEKPEGGWDDAIPLILEKEGLVEA